VFFFLLLVRDKSFIIRHAGTFTLNDACWSSVAVIKFKKLWHTNEYSLKKIPEEKEEDTPGFLEPQITPVEPTFNEPYKMQPLF
jgi:hypothetical protein